MSTGLLAIRASGDANNAEQKRLAERKRNILVLINQYLIEQGYIEAAERLQSEANNVLSKFGIADNIDLSLILADFETYYEMRFTKKPKIYRKLSDDEVAPKPPISKNSSKKPSKTDSDSGKLPNISNNSSENNLSDQGFGITGTTIASNPTDNSKSKKSNIDEPIEKVLKPPPNFGGEPEMKQLASIISREIYQESPNVRFEDIVHLEEAKRLLMEAVQLPLRYPSIFTGILRPWRGILLHGPPGTGKTLLAKAVATECNTTFFNISASTLISKWRGDSEKLVRVLFELARYHAPSTIFLDEIDSILSSRDGEGAEHEASRRMKTELLIQMDGLQSKNQSSQDQVFVMAASNIPWELDVALLRRLEKRVFVSLPGVEAREMMIKKHLNERISENGNFDFTLVARETDGYSGADLELLCREAAMMPVRRLIRKIDSLEQDPKIPDPPSKGNTNKRPNPAPFNIPSKQSLINQEIDSLLKNDPVSMDDILTALTTTKSSSNGNIERYLLFICYFLFISFNLMI